MKRNYIYASFLAATLAFAGCQDMDTLPDGGLITSGQKDDAANKNPERAEAKVNAVFATFSQAFPNASALGAERHNDIGYPTIMLAMGSNGADEISDDNGYNWTGNSLTYDDRPYTSLECQMVWNDLYAIVFAANNVVKSFDPNTEDENQKYFLAQGLASRAFAYWVLAQLYQFNYVGHENEPCVPIITEKNAESAAVDGCKRSTVKEVYTQIDSDLKEACRLMEGNTVKRKDKRYMSLSVIYGLYARMYLTQQNWAKAAEYADKAIAAAGNEGLSIASIESVSHPTFWSSTESNWMWGIIINETDGVVDTGICNWPSHMGSLSYGYSNFSGGRQINKLLYKAINESDARKGWWLNETGESYGDALNDAQKGFVADYGYKPYTQVKFAPYNNAVGTTINANDIPLMRLEEMYLIKAEAQAMGGNPGQGVKTLEDFLKFRIDDPKIYTNGVTSATQVQEAVYLQRRIELWGEGMNWFDVMRLNKGVDRTDAGYPNVKTSFKIEPTDNILLWRIPEAEIQANKGLSEADALPIDKLPGQ